MISHSHLTHKALLQVLVFAFSLSGIGSAQTTPPNLTAAGAIAAVKAREDIPKYDNTFNLGSTGLRGWIFQDWSGTWVGKITSPSRQILVTTASTPGSAVMAVDDVILGAVAASSGTVPLFISDARKAFGTALTNAEKNGAGTLRVKRWRAGATDDVNIPITTLGEYSATAPYNCPKSALILANARDQMVGKLLADPNYLSPSLGHASAINALALLASVKSGDPNFAEVQTRLQTYARSLTMPVGNGGTWGSAYELIYLAEYYLLTSDSQVVPVINGCTLRFAKGQGMFGTFGHGLGIPHPDGSGRIFIPWYGPVNVAGNAANVAIVLGKKALQAAGQPIDPAIDAAIQRSSGFMGSHVNKGAMQYGEHFPHAGSHATNSREPSAAVFFGLQTDKAVQTEYFARTSISSWIGLEVGHSGQGWGTLWGTLGSGMGGEAAASAHFKQLLWRYDIQRRTDGSFTYDSDTGGNEYYGGKTADGTYLGESLDSDVKGTALYLLTYSLPLKRLFITGKDLNTAYNHNLDATKVAHAVSAASFPLDRTSMSIAQLFTYLGDYDPHVRHFASLELASRHMQSPVLTSADLTNLRNLLNDPNPNFRQSAAQALGYLQDSAALPTLVARLRDPDHWVRQKAANAIRYYSNTAAVSVYRDAMLEAFIANGPADPDTIDWIDPLQFSNGTLGQLLFGDTDPDGAIYPRYSIAASTANATKATHLYPALRIGLQIPSGRYRSAAANFLNNYLSPADAQALFPEVVEVQSYIAPGDSMFGGGPRDEAMKFLAASKIKEGIPLALAILEEGGGNEALAALASYGDAARYTLPTLRRYRAEWPMFDGNGNLRSDYVNLLNTITTIENAITAPTTIPGLCVANAQVVATTTGAKAITLTGASPRGPFSFLNVTQPANGTLTGTAPNLTYTPNAGYTGPDKFTFQTKDSMTTSDPATVSIIVGSAAGTGITGTYFDNINFTNQKVTRTDPQINFDWGTTTPSGSGLTGGNTFSVRWGGQLRVPETGTYTFSTLNSDGARIYVNGQMVIDDYVDQTTNWKDGSPINLTAGQLVDLQMLYYENTGSAVAKLKWTGPSFAGPNGDIIGSQWLYNSTTLTPYAHAQTVTMLKDTSKPITLTGSGGTLTYAIDTSPAQGTLTGTAPNLTYTPPAGFSGAVSFTFTVNNGTSTSAPATVSINVQAGALTNFTWANAVSGNWSDATKWTPSLPVAGGLPFYALNFTNSGTYTATHNLNDGFQLNQLNTAAEVTLDGPNSVSFVANGSTLPQFNQNGPDPVSVTHPISLQAMTLVDGSGYGAVNLNGTISGTGGIIKNCAGNLTLAENNTYSGGTILNSGTLTMEYQKNTALGTGPITFNNGAVLKAGRPDASNPIIVNRGELDFASGWGNTWNGPITLNGDLTLITPSFDNITINGIISGAGGLIADVPWWWEYGAYNSSNGVYLTATNSYTGKTIVRNGITLICTKAAALGSGALEIKNFSRVNLLFTGTKLVASMTLDGVVMPPGTYGSTASPATNKNDLYFIGTGTISVMGPLETSLTVAISGNGTTSPAGSMVVLKGSTTAISATTATGNDFVNWTITEGAPTIADANSSSTTVTINEPATVMANFAPKTYAVTYNGNGNTSGAEPASQVKTYGQNLIISDSTGNLSKTNFFFAGWNTAADGSGINYSAGVTYTGNASLALYAMWAPLNSLIWDANGTTLAQTDGGGGWIADNLWWNGANTTWSSGLNAIFGNGAVGGAVTLASPTTVDGIIFNSFTGTYTLGTAGQLLTINSGIHKTSASAAVIFASPIALGGDQTWVNHSAGLLKTGNGTNLITNNGYQLTVGGTGTAELGVINNSAVTISGSGALVKNDTGRLNIGGTNSGFTGSVTINGGVVQVFSNAGALGNGNLTLNGGVLSFNSNTTYTRTLGTGVSQVRIPGGESGIAASGSGSTINLGSSVVWGASGEGSATGFFNPSKLVLGDSGTSNAATATFSSAIDLNGTTRTIAEPKGLNAAGNVSTISGTISSSGAAGLIKEGGGTLVLSVNNTYTGDTTISGGNLRIGNNTAGQLNSGDYSANISIASSSALQIWSSSAQILRGTISGAGELQKNHAGTLALTANNTYTGPTTVTAGRLLINGNHSAATGNVSVAANATLGGTGVIGGNTTIADTGKLEFNISTAAASHDKLELAAGKSLTFSGASVLTITTTSGATTGTYTLLTAPGGITGAAPANLILPAGWAATVGIVGNDLVLNVTVIDTTLPVISTFSPADDASSVALDANLVATFDENIVIGTGNITIKNLTNATNVTIPITDAQVSVSGNVLTINPTVNLLSEKNYAVQIAATAIDDALGNSFAGIANDTTWNFRTADVTAPTPNPMTFAVLPAVIGETSITMTATTATDTSLVQYFFDCTSGGGPDSGWQSSAVFTPTGLAYSTTYSYTVRARDTSLNESAPSAVASVTTPAQDITAPTPNPMTLVALPSVVAYTSITMTAAPAADPSGVEYFFECTAGGGDSSGWQDSPTYTDSGLAAETQYSYRVRARDKSPAQNATAWSASASATTEPRDTTTYTNPTTSTGSSSSWTTATNWNNGVPTGNVNVVIPDKASAFSVTVHAFGVPGPYVGDLRIGNNVTLVAGFTGNNNATIDYALGTPGSTVIYMGSNSLFNFRNSYNGRPTAIIPSIVLLGNAAYRNKESTNTAINADFNHSITGPHTFTMDGSGINTLKAANNLSGLNLTTSSNTVGAVAGSIGSATVTLSGNSKLTLNATGAMTDNPNPIRIDNGTLELGTSAAVTAPLALTNRPIQLHGAGGATINNANNANSNANTLSLGTVSATASGAKTLTLGGINTGANTISGNLTNGTGTIGVTKAGTGNWTLIGTANTFTGAITLSSTTTSAGTLAYASAGGANAITFNQTTGSATLSYTGSEKTMSGPITANALTSGTITLVASGSGAVNYSNPASLGSAGSGIKNLVLSGTNTGNNILAGQWVNNTGAAATLTKNGGGTWVISGNNTYTGITSVTAGKLLINGDQSSATGNVSVAANATLGGTGIIGGNTTIAANGKLEFNLSTAAASHDKLELAAAKSLTFSGASVLTITGTAGAAPGSYTLLTAPGGIIGSAPATLNLPSGWSGTVGKVGNDLVLNLTSTSSGPGPVASFAISSIASPQTVGTPITGITLTAKDAANATATSFTGTVTFSGTGGFTGTSTNFVAGVLTGVSVTPTVAGGNLTFTVNDGASHTGSVTIATIRTPYEAWATGGFAFNHDTNNDGVDNGMAWLLGATNPSENAAEKLPKATRNGSHLHLTFRCLKSTKRAGVILKVQSSSDMGLATPWPNHEAAVPDSDSTVNNMNFDTTENGDYLDVIVNIPVVGPKIFVRLCAVATAP